MLSVRRHYPRRGRFTENLSIYLSSPAPNSPLQNPSNFGATASHWLLYILLFFFFLILTGWMRGALCVATRLYILYLAADESISGWEFLLLIPKSPHLSVTIFFHIILLRPSYPRSYTSKTTWGKNKITSGWNQIANGNTACPGDPINTLTASLKGVKFSLQ